MHFRTHDLVAPRHCLKLVELHHHFVVFCPTDSVTSLRCQCAMNTTETIALCVRESK